MQVVPFEFMNGQHDFVTTDDRVALLQARRIITGKSYPLPGCDWSPRCVLDLGGYVGEFSVMAKLRWPQTKVICVEPNPAILPLARQNANKFGFDLIEKAVNIFRGKAKLMANSYGAVANSLVTRPGETGESVEVECVRIQDLMAYWPEVLKIDIEGLDYLVLLNAQTDGYSYRDVALIYLEFHTADDRKKIDDMLYPTHELWKADIEHFNQGECMYIHREYSKTIPQPT